MKVTVSEDGRIDKALAKAFPEAGRKALAALFDEGAVTIRGKRAKKGDRVAVGDEIEVTHAPATGDALRPVAEARELSVLLERDDLVVIDKPAGMPSQPLKASELGTVANAIVARWPECAAIGDDPRDGGLVHRLDIGTSGVLVAARTEAAYRALRDAFGAGQVHKEYLALVEGRPVSRDADAPLVQRGNHVVVDYADGLAAYTSFTVERASASHALVRCTAQTGRMHQVRAHLAHVGAPIVGDTIYGGTELPSHAGFFLHAALLRLPDGTTLTAPLPPAFSAALAACGLVS